MKHTSGCLMSAASCHRDRPLTGRLRDRNTFANGDTCDMSWHHGDWIEDGESITSPPSRWAFDPYLREAFEQAGWQPRPPPAPTAEGDAAAYAQALLEEFGGLKLHAGTTEEIDFLSAPIPLWRSDVQRWPGLEDSMVIASVKNTYAALFVDGQGRFYVTDDICHGPYLLGDGFVAAANILLRNLPWSNAVGG